MTARATNESIRVDSELVKLQLNVTDRYGRPVLDLKRDDFSVTDNGVAQAISFFGDDDSPVSLGIVFDLSGSMRDSISDARIALENLIRAGHPQDEYFLIAFNKRSQLLLDHAIHGEDVIRQLERAVPTGGTSLFDAVYLGMDRVQHGIYRKKVLLIITDGQDNSSRYSIKDVVKSEEESGVIVYALGITRDLFLRERRATEYSLEEITRSTGGRSYLAYSESDVDAALDHITSEIRHLYVIAFSPSPPASVPPFWHTLRVTLLKKEQAHSPRIRARPGYMGGYRAPAN